jgi:ArsR family transcriptional regulator
MSRHMAVLRNAGLVVDRRDAQWVRYRITPNLPADIATLLQAALALNNEREKEAA